MAGPRCTVYISLFPTFHIKDANCPLNFSHSSPPLLVLSKRQCRAWHGKHTGQHLKKFNASRNSGSLKQVVPLVILLASYKDMSETPCPPAGMLWAIVTPAV